MAKAQDSTIQSVLGPFPVGFVQFHGTVFFGGKNFKERIDVRTDKCKNNGPIQMEYNRETQELRIFGEGAEMFLPSTSLFGYVLMGALPPKVTAFSGVGANTSLNAQVSGPHDHVFAGLGSGQTGAGARVK